MSYTLPRRLFRQQVGRTYAPCSKRCVSPSASQTSSLQILPETRALERVPRPERAERPRAELEDERVQVLRRAVALSDARAGAVHAGGEAEGADEAPGRRKGVR